MKLLEEIHVTRIAEWIGAEIQGEKDMVVTGINEIHKVVKGDITFVDIEKYYDRALNSEASVIIINKYVDDIPPGKTILMCKDPFEAYYSLTRKFRPPSFRASRTVDVMTSSPSRITPIRSQVRSTEDRT